MPLALGNYHDLAQAGIKQFWSGRSSVLTNDEENSQGGERDGVLAGKNMDGFLVIIEGIVRSNGLPNAEIFTASRPNLTLPGYFRPTKLWDVIVMDQGRLVAAIEFKSHVGSFSNNFNNRAEEAIGTAHDLQIAIREGMLIKKQLMPFLGWLIMVEDSLQSRQQSGFSARHFPVFEKFLAPAVEPPPEFTKTGRLKKSEPRPRKLVSYLDRYDILCSSLMQEGLYTRASVITSPRESVDTGFFSDVSPETGLKQFVAGLAGHVAAWTA